MFESKIRRVGNSLGALIPNDVITQNALKEGDVITLVITKKAVGNTTVAFLKKTEDSGNEAVTDLVYVEDSYEEET